MGEPGKVEVHNAQAWVRYLEAEKRELLLTQLSLSYAVRRLGFTVIVARSLPR